MDVFFVGSFFVVAGVIGIVVTASLVSERRQCNALAKALQHSEAIANNSDSILDYHMTIAREANDRLNISKSENSKLKGALSRSESKKLVYRDLCFSYQKNINSLNLQVLSLEERVEGMKTKFQAFLEDIE